MKTGKISENVLKRSVLSQLRTRGKEVLNGAGIGLDCAIFSFSGRLVASCVQEAAIRIRPDESGFPYSAQPCFPIAHLVQKCANNLAAAGAHPSAVMIAVFLPEDLDEPVLRELMSEAEEICGRLSIAIAGGQTRVVKGISLPIAAVTGFGTLPQDSLAALRTSGSAKPGQDVVISKWIALEGTALLAERCREGLRTRLPAHLIEEAAGFDRFLSVLPEAEIAVNSGVSAMHDASEGGIFAALWELAEASGIGLTIDLKKLPLRQETVEVCEYCNINPYGLLSGGSLVMTAEDGPGLAAALEARHIPAAIVGKVTDSNDRLIMNGDETRYMDRPRNDEIYRVFQEPNSGFELS